MRLCETNMRTINMKQLTEQDIEMVNGAGLSDLVNRFQDNANDTLGDISDAINKANGQINNSLDKASNWLNT